MADVPALLRALPRVDEVLAHQRLTAISQEAPRALCRQAARAAVEEARSLLLRGDPPAGLTLDAIAARAAQILRRRLRPHLSRAINATGIVLHTGLGRAPFSSSAQAALAEVAAGYCNLQADLETGQRMPRESHVHWLFQELTGAEATLVVNNNAAATVLVLNTLAAGKEVIVSRGEMVEIGGSFRLPEIIALAGCRLVEVGCTNRTHLRDYENGITPETAVLLAVHQSNYRIEGFTSQVEIGELAALARARGLICVHDLGSGALVDLAGYGLPREPTVPDSLAAGAEVVLFSGDKLLGGPQCGVILGNEDALAAMRRNPFYRAFRVGKLTLSVLEATLRLFLEPESLPKKHGLMALLLCSPEAIRERAEALAREAQSRGGGWLRAEVQEGESEVGGGSLAGHSLPTTVVALRSDRVSSGELARLLRLSEPPIFARVHRDRVLLDPRTVLSGEDATILDALARIGADLQER